ncbi:MAG: DUF2480 family protein [Chitinophagaceae bacterium]|nr:MAG: DUF2480 family protein [Chitinophagaceae bacterium]
MEDQIINKVAESGVVTLDLSQYIPSKDGVLFDIKEFLFAGLILKEKEFRETLKKEAWEKYSNKNIAITCSADAIVPVWAYMLIVSYLQPHANEIIFGTENDLYAAIIIKNISKINTCEFTDKRVVVKGCGDKKIDELAYVEATKILMPVVKSIMYGEPCSTVPIYKKK